jgi:GcrA cell cycle regulator
MDTWTPERIEWLRNLEAKGLSCAQIADQMGVSRNAVIGKLHRLGISRGRPTRGAARTSPPRANRARQSPRRTFLRLMLSASPPSAGDAGVRHDTVHSAQPCSLLDLGLSTCRWPMGNPDAAGFAFCNNEVYPGCPYCAGHALIAYRIPPARSATRAA